MYPYACDYDKWGFSDKNGNIKVSCKYEATYIVQGICSYPQTLREDAYFVRKKGKLYILDKGQETRFQEVDTFPIISAIYKHYIIFKHYRKEEYQVYLRNKKKLLHQIFIQPPNIDTLNNQVYGVFVKDSSVVIDYHGKKILFVKAQSLIKNGKIYIAHEDYKTAKLYNQNGKAINKNNYSNIDRFQKGGNFIFLVENEKYVKLLYPNGTFFDTKVEIEDSDHIRFFHQNGISLIINSHKRDSISVYNHKGQKIINEPFKNVFHGENTYLVSNFKTYRLGPENIILDSINHSIDDKKGNTFIKYFGIKMGTYEQKVDSSYVFDGNLKFFKKFDGYVFNVFFDSLYFVVNESYNYLEDYKNDTLILCDKTMHKMIDNKLRGSIYSQFNYGIWGDEYWDSKILRAGSLEYTFKNGILVQTAPSLKSLYIHKDRVLETDIECIVDTTLLKYDVIDYSNKYQDESKERERQEALEKARFENRRLFRLFGYLNVDRDTIMPFIYEEGIPHRNFITFEKDSIWTVFDTFTYEKTIYDRRHIIDGHDYEILSNLFFKVEYPSNRYFQIVHHLNYGVLFDGNPVSYFSDNWHDFMIVKFDEEGPKKLIHAPSGVLIDDFDNYKNGNYCYYYNDVSIFKSSISSFPNAPIYNITYDPNLSDDFKRYDLDLEIFHLGEKILFMNPETMKFLASDALMEKLRVKKYKSIYPE